MHSLLVITRVGASLPDHRKVLSRQLIISPLPLMRERAVGRRVSKARVRGNKMYTEPSPRFISRRVGAAAVPEATVVDAYAATANGEPADLEGGRIQTLPPRSVPEQPFAVRVEELVGRTDASVAPTMRPHL